MKKLMLLILLAMAWQLNAQNNKITVHDPVAIQADGKYYLFNTGFGVAAWVSSDMKNWEHLKSVLDPIPAWAKEEIPRSTPNIWAPDVSFHNGMYYLYYSVSSFGSNHSCIGVVTNKTLNPDDPDFKWEDHGVVVESVSGRDNWNAIDPNLIFDENNTPWLSFGSFWDGLKMVKLSDDLLSVADPEEWYTIASRNRNNSRNTAIEAPFIFKHEDYYYLFASFDFCCRGEESTYNVRVGRSKKVTGPYIDKDGVSMLDGGGTQILGPDDNYFGQGHNSAYTFDNKDYLICHGYSKADNGRSVLVIREMEWDADGWPVLKEEEN